MGVPEFSRIFRSRRGGSLEPNQVRRWETDGTSGSDPSYEQLLELLEYLKDPRESLDNRLSTHVGTRVPDACAARLLEWFDPIDPADGLEKLVWGLLAPVESSAEWTKRLSRCDPGWPETKKQLKRLEIGQAREMFVAQSIQVKERVLKAEYADPAERARVADVCHQLCRAFTVRHDREPAQNDWLPMRLLVMEDQAFVLEVVERRDLIWVRGDRFLAVLRVYWLWWLLHETSRHATITWFADISARVQPPT